MFCNKCGTENNDYVSFCKNCGNAINPNTVVSNVPEKKSVGLSVASMVLGIVSLLLSCCVYYLSIPCALLAIILGGASISGKKGGKGMAIAGIVTGIISLVPAIIVIIIGASIFSELGIM